MSFDVKKVRRLGSFKTKHEPRMYVNSLVRPHHKFSQEERLRAAMHAGWNVFQFPSEMLWGGDLLSDSGTATLTSEQFAAMMLGDEAYGTNYGYSKLIRAMEETFGISTETHEIYLFHQCRAAEHALFSQLGKRVPQGSIIPSNGHFDTTRANIEANGIGAFDHFSNENKSFSGNMNLRELIDYFKDATAFGVPNIPLVYCTVTNNTDGGQPVSLYNLRATQEMCTLNKIPFFLDACRFAENAWFIKQREPQYKNATILEIIHTMFSLCDGFTISFKKDGLSNMGGALVIKRDSIFTEKYQGILEAIRDHQILTEGHPTYGGMTGRDIMVVAEGLKIVVTNEYLRMRTEQVASFGTYMNELGIPVMKPFGGHAVYIDVDKFFEGTDMQREDFGGISLTALLLLKGVRLCELGAFAFGKWNHETKKEEFDGKNFVRCAVPRMKYEIEDLKYVADCVKSFYDRRDQIPKAIPVYGRELTLRHFKARFELNAD